MTARSVIIYAAAVLAVASAARAAERTFDVDVNDELGRRATAHVVVGDGAQVCGPLRITGRRDGEERVLYQLAKGHCL